MAEIENNKPSESEVSEPVNVTEPPKRRGRPPKSANVVVEDANTTVIAEPNVSAHSNDVVDTEADIGDSLKAPIDYIDRSDVSDINEGSDLTPSSSPTDCSEGSTIDCNNVGVECAYAPVCNAIRKQIRCGSWYYKSPNANCAVGQMPCKCSCSVIEYIGKFVKVRAHIPSTGLRTIYVCRDDII